MNTQRGPHGPSGARLPSNGMDGDSRLNIRISEEIHRKLRLRAAAEGKSINDLVLEAMQRGGLLD
jgi:predicted HicB family RNase H-like nuclease